MDFAKRGYDKETYALAFTIIRNDFITNNFLDKKTNNDNSQLAGSLSNLARNHQEESNNNYNKYIIFCFINRCCYTFKLVTKRKK